MDGLTTERRKKHFSLTEWSAAEIAADPVMGAAIVSEAVPDFILVL